MRKFTVFTVVICMLIGMIIPVSAAETLGIDLLKYGYFTLDGVDVQQYHITLTDGKSHTFSFPKANATSFGDYAFVMYSTGGTSFNISINTGNVSVEKLDSGYFLVTGYSGRVTPTWTISGSSTVSFVSAYTYGNESFTVKPLKNFTFSVSSLNNTFTTTITPPFAPDLVISSGDQYFSEFSAMFSFAEYGGNFISLHIGTSYINFTSISAFVKDQIVPVSVSYLKTENAEGSATLVGSGGYDEGDTSYSPSHIAIQLDLTGVQLGTGEPLDVYIDGYIIATKITSSNVYPEFNIFSATEFYPSANPEPEPFFLYRIWKTLIDILDQLTQDETEVEDSESDQADQEEEGSDILGELDTMTKPPQADIEQQAGIDEYVDQTGVTVLSNTLSAFFTEGSLIKTVIMLSLTFAFISYVLFGKK